MNGQRRWIGEPEKCTCRRIVVATIGETLSCPLGWRYDPRFGWLHLLPGRPS